MWKVLAQTWRDVLSGVNKPGTMATPAGNSGYRSEQINDPISHVCKQSLYKHERQTDTNAVGGNTGGISVLV